MRLSLLRFTGTAAATLAALCAAGAYPTLRWAGGDGLVAMGWAAGITLAGAVIGLLPTIFAGPQPAARVRAAMLGMVVRLFVTMVAVVAILASEATPARVAFAVWVGVDYAAMIVLETIVVLRGARHAPTTGSSIPA